MDKQKTAAAIHDMSGFGRCALSVILPVVSAMGVQCIPVPTAVMSTHTGGFTGFVLRDMTDYIDMALAHYLELGLKFDCIYTGFLASEKQADSCIAFFKAFPNALKVIDPVMGDNGSAYQTYTDGLIRRTKELISYADVITPNITEAAILLDEPYPEKMSEKQLNDWLRRLCDRCPAAIITGVHLTDGSYANACMDRENEQSTLIRWERIPVSYPGTGDIFASVLTGGILQGKTLGESMQLATDFCSLAIRETYKTNEPARNGVQFERVLSFLTEQK